MRGLSPLRQGTRTMTQFATTAGLKGVPALLVLESYPETMDTSGPALPEGSPQFRTACRRWRVPSELLARVPRLNAVERAPKGRSTSWLGEARGRVEAALRAHQPRTIIAAGWLARDAVREVVSPGSRLPWLKVVDVVCPGGARASVVAVPHYSTRGRLLNDEQSRAATAAAIRVALTGT